MCPGVGKTMMARALSVSLGVDFRRLQCTPDLLPSDITGTSIFNQETRQFLSSLPARRLRTFCWLTR